MRKTLRILSGSFLCILGVIGIIMPVMPGWIFLVPGLVILAEYFPWAKTLLDKVKRLVERKQAAGEKLD